MKYTDGYIDDVDGCCGDVMCKGLDPIDGRDAMAQGLFKCLNFDHCHTYVDHDGDWCDACINTYPNTPRINPFDGEEA